MWYSRDGKPLVIAGPAASYSELSISPDGSRIAVVRSERSGEDIWLIETARTTPVRLTFHGGMYPVWSPDGRRIAFLRDPNRRLIAIDTDGSGREENLTDTLYGVLTPHSWSPDGKFLLYTFYSYQFEAKTRNDEWLLPLNGSRKPVPLLQTEFQEIRGNFSPDGRWISYTSDESGRSEIYVRKFASDGTKRLVSSNGGDYSRWRKDGRELFYKSSGGKLMSVMVRGDQFAAPAVLFDIGNRLFDVAPDGRRFLALNPIEETEVSTMMVLVNWEQMLYSAGK
jgi:Tol biopolymer transport system component